MVKRCKHSSPHQVKKYHQDLTFCSRHLQGTNIANLKDYKKELRPQPILNTKALLQYVHVYVYTLTCKTSALSLSKLTCKSILKSRRHVPQMEVSVISSLSCKTFK